MNIRLHALFVALGTSFFAAHAADSEHITTPIDHALDTIQTTVKSMHHDEKPVVTHGAYTVHGGGLSNKKPLSTTANRLHLPTRPAPSISLMPLGTMPTMPHPRG